jgi:hypothetical protein
VDELGLDLALGSQRDDQLVVDVLRRDAGRKESRDDDARDERERGEGRAPSAESCRLRELPLSNSLSRYM